jgi:integrase/recombinase XerC
MWLGENYGDLDLYSDEFMENAVDIMENYIMFCQETLLNHKKIINMLSTNINWHNILILCKL